MSKYAQHQLRKKMRKASRPGPGSPNQGQHWVPPSEHRSTSGQRRVQRAEARRKLIEELS